MTQRKLKAGDPVMLPSGLVTELTDIQYEHNRYQLLEAVSGWQYGIENLRTVEWKLEVQKWRREALRKYPTPEAYEAACAALEKHRSRADAAEDREQRLKEAAQKVVDHTEPITYLSEMLSTLYPDTPAPTNEEDLK